MVDMLKGIGSDLVYAARSLGKAPAVTFVCVVSLGIGMAPVIAVPYLARIPHTPPPGGVKRPVYPLYVSAGYFRTIGVPVWRGAGFEDQTSAVVVLGYEFWQDQLSSDPEIIGKTLHLDDAPFVVAGIAPQPFGGHLG